MQAASSRSPAPGARRCNIPPVSTHNNKDNTVPGLFFRARLRSAFLRCALCCALAPLPAAQAQPAAPAAVVPEADVPATPATSAAPATPAVPLAQPGADVMAVLGLMDAAAMLRLSEEEKSGAKYADPEMRTFYAEAIRNYDENEILRRLGLLMEGQVSAEHVRQIAAFAATPGGRAVGRIIQAYKEPGALVAALNRLLPADLAAANRVYASPAMQSWQRAMASPQFRQVSVDYGQELVCRHARASRPAMYASLQGGGRCLGAP